MKRPLPVATLAVAALLLTGCGAATDTRHADTVAYLTTTTQEKAGEATTTAYTDAGIFDGIADDLLGMCGAGTQHLYAANVGSDLSETVLSAYDIACPE